MLMLAQLVIDYREMWKLTSLSSSAGVLLPLALRSTVWICCTGMHRSVAGSYTTAAHSRSDSEEGLFSESNYFKSQKSEWWRVFGIFRSVADQEWAARLKHSAKKTGVWLGGLVCWHTIQVHLHHDHWLHGLVSDSDHSWSPLTVTCLLTGSIRWRRRCLTLWLWLVAGLWGLGLTLTCLSAVWSHGHSGAQVHLEDDIF